MIFNLGKCCTPYIMDSPSPINTRQRNVRGTWPNLRVWCTSAVVGSHFGRPCCQLRGSVRCASSLEIPLASGDRPPSLLPPSGRLGLLAGAQGAPFKENVNQARGIFRKCRGGGAGCGLVPGPTLKRPCAVFLLSWPDLRDTITCDATAFLDFGPERGPGKGTMADLGPLIRHLVSTRLPSGGQAAFLSPLSPLYGTRPSV